MEEGRGGLQVSADERLSGRDSEKGKLAYTETRNIKRGAFLHVTKEGTSRRLRS
jgi:hypothetical protein